ncbi:MAG: D-alanyl-D-alanine carboxypeptidase [Candidatus Carbobacillus altaicus]|uniref:serine-type D-Ala-D-Ala carboxypeptidase n=1 Tax=Candidatus Carbonibacillus altaicus TaxID=2163959 RepID=A0A2R6Y1Y9_9BACL|nr:MAG: D-alanyl-D-alanine carboxypeptidase [Candidatus Carbobacillus altaicus]
MDTIRSTQAGKRIIGQAIERGWERMHQSFLSLFKRILYALILFALLLFDVPSVARAEDAPGLDLNVRAAILMETETGQILYAQDPDTPYPPASMTKMMAEYLVLESIKNGKIHWDDRVVASDYVYFLGKDKGSRVFINQGEERTVRELFAAMAIYSANDATAMLAEYIAGSETAFVQMMNEKARAFGMEHTHFVTSSGYPEDDLGPYRPNIEGEQMMSARDAAILGWHLITDFPEVTEFTATPKAVFREGEKNPVNMLNWNKLLPGMPFYYEGADGLKTGHTSAAKWSITATAKRGDMRLVAVIIGAESEDERFTNVRRLFDYGFNNFSRVQVLSHGDVVPGYETLKVSGGKRKDVSLVTDAALHVMWPKGETIDVTADMFSVTLDADKAVAPLKAGTVLGYVQLKHHRYPLILEQGMGENSGPEVALVSREDVERASPIALFFRAIGSFIADLWNSIMQAIGGWFGK